jgi:hypothetical protein
MSHSGGSGLRVLGLDPRSSLIVYQHFLSIGRKTFSPHFPRSYTEKKDV